MTGPAARSSGRDVKRAASVSPPEIVPVRSSRDFRRVLDEGSRHRSGGLVLVRAEGTDGPPRLGLVVSRSSGSAVTRNRIKRRLRHSVRQMKLQPGNDYVIIASRQVADVAYPQLLGWLERALAESER